MHAHSGEIGKSQHGAAALQTQGVGQTDPGQTENYAA